MALQFPHAVRSSAIMLGAVIAVLACPLLPGLPHDALVAATGLCGLMLLLAGDARPLGVLFVVFAVCVQMYSSRLEQRLDPSLSGAVTNVEGTVVTLPRQRDEMLEFLFRPAEATRLPPLMLVRWYREWPQVAVGERWSLLLRLQPPWGLVNFHGSDRERWLFARNIGARATVREGLRLGQESHSSFRLQRLRDSVNAKIAGQVDDPLEEAVIRALATADRGNLDPATNELLRKTGTLHLLAISGLHIGLVAMGGMVIGRLLLRCLPVPRRGRAAFLFPLLTATVLAAAYAMLADLGISTVRALLMLLTVMAVLAASRSVSSWRVFLLALTAVLLSNPFAPLSSGFWYSFAAVLVLLWTFQPRPAARGPVTAAMAAQAAVFLVMLPLNAAWQGSAGPSAYPANLLAIPWVSFTVVPPVLAGVVLSPFTDLASGFAWSLAGISVSGLFTLLETLADWLPGMVPLKSLAVPALLLAVAGALVLLLPRGLPGRWTGLFFLLPLFLPPSEPVEPGALLVEALDVGQGTALLIGTTSGVSLYDTGPGDGDGADRVASVIVPAIHALGLGTPDRLVISHSDLDHSGGLHSLLNRYPGLPLTGSFESGAPGAEPCVSGLSWRRDGFSFRVLHPSAGLPYLKNNSSCVLALRRGAAGLLLPGDIENAVEERLQLEGLEPFPLMMAAHHGSAGSTGDAFIEAVSPRAVFATAGLGNRFGFPRSEVRRRLARRGIPLWPTGECGGLSITVDEHGEIRAASARRSLPRIWRWPAAGGCP